MHLPFVRWVISVHELIWLYIDNKYAIDMHSIVHLLWNCKFLLIQVGKHAVVMSKELVDTGIVDLNLVAITLVSADVADNYLSHPSCAYTGYRQRLMALARVIPSK